jgi:hypothetical protein
MPCRALSRFAERPLLSSKKHNARRQENEEDGGTEKGNESPFGKEREFVVVEPSPLPTVVG